MYVGEIRNKDSHINDLMSKYNKMEEQLALISGEFERQKRLL